MESVYARALSLPSSEGSRGEAADMEKKTEKNGEGLTVCMMN